MALAKLWEGDKLELGGTSWFFALMMGWGPDLEIRLVLASSRKGAELGAGTPVVGACVIMGECRTLESDAHLGYRGS